MKIFIPCAGVGSRIAAYTRYRNKALLTLGNAAAITRIIEKFEKNIPIVIAVGYQKEILKEYLSFAHGNRQIEFVDVDKYEGNGSGLGYTMLAAKELLNEEFIFIPNDTIIENENIQLDPSIEGNWFGVYKKVLGDGIDRQHYRCVLPKGPKKNSIAPKGILSDEIYMGLCGIKDHTAFWVAMENPDAILEGESFALNSLSETKAVYFKNWVDTGNLESLSRATEQFKSVDHNILNKEDEAIWLFEDIVIKHHKDKQFISDRIKRLDYIDAELTPNLISVGSTMFKYKKVPGKVLSKTDSIIDYQKTLDEVNLKLWSHKEKSGKNKKAILEKFYFIKTQERRQHFLDRFQSKDEEVVINGLKCGRVDKLLKKICWESIYKSAVFSRFHGDFHPENIIMDNLGNVKLLDWRQNFTEGEYEFGDLYYDLAKFMHGLIVDHNKVNLEKFTVKFVTATEIIIDIETSFIKSQLLNTFEDWVTLSGYDIELVRLHTSLIFINIAGLHDYPYSQFLFFLGQFLLQNEIRRGSKYIIE